MFPEGVFASAMALLSQLLAASAGVEDFPNSGKGSVVFAVFAAGLEDAAKGERRKHINC